MHISALGFPVEYIVQKSAVLFPEYWKEVQFSGICLLASLIFKNFPGGKMSDTDD